MNVFKKPGWLNEFRYPFDNYDMIPPGIFDTINENLDKRIHEDPLVSIIIPAWNEEVNILRTLGSLSLSATSFPFEIIVVNNNSTDKTAETLKKLHVKTVFQPVQGWGPTRQIGMEHARGKYILLADADCIYPACWIEEMMKVLQQPGVACVYGRYSFLPIPGFTRWKLFLFEKMKDMIAELRHFRRPHLNAFGMSMGYVKEYGLEIGYVMHKIRGEDGRLCYDLMKYGKVLQVKNNRARVWTFPRSLQRDGNIGTAFRKRFVKEMKRISHLLTYHPPHDTKTSENT